MRVYISNPVYEECQKEITTHPNGRQTTKYYQEFTTLEELEQFLKKNPGDYLFWDSSHWFGQRFSFIDAYEG